MSKPQSQLRSRLIRAGIATAAVTGVLVAGATPAFAASVPLTLSSVTGPSGTLGGAGPITITASAATAWLTGVPLPYTTFSVPACTTTLTAAGLASTTPSSATVGNVPTTAPTDTKRISTTKATILVPDLPIAPVSATTMKYNVCVYASTTLTDPLIGTATYTVAPAPTFTSTPVSPTKGPAVGGSIITVSGTGLPTTAGSITASLGGAPLTGITPISSTGFTATTPAHAPGVVSLSVTTAGGTKTVLTSFTYSNGINVSPNTASSAAALNPVFVDVSGANFLSYGFGTYVPTGSPSTNAQVFLVDGTYTLAAGAYTNGPVAVCSGVVVISDSELICSLQLDTGLRVKTTGALVGTSPVPDGTYTITIVSNGAGAAVTPVVSDLSSGSTFTVADY